MKYRSFIRPAALAATLVLTTVIVAHAAIKEVAPGTSMVTAKATGGLTIEGKGKGVTASETNGVITITAPVNKLETGLSLRNDHLRDAIHAEKHPNATLAVKRDALKFPGDGAKVEADATGDFTINNVTKPLKFHYSVVRKGTHYVVHGTAKLDFTKHGIEEPGYLGVKVKKDVEIAVDVTLHD
jgi:polyisoprenoid-binding protein YceI